MKGFFIWNSPFFE